MATTDTSLRARTQSILTTTASIITERPTLDSKPVGQLLKVTMYVGLAGCAAAVLFGLLLGGAMFVVWLYKDLALEIDPGAVAKAGEIIPWSKLAFQWAMIVSTLYGFASFMWYKLEAGRVIGTWLSTLLFLIVPMTLLAVKLMNEWPAFYDHTGFIFPAELIVVAEYYSFVWYCVIFMVAAFSARRGDADGKGPRVLPRWAVFGVLCYLPYGYVLFVGEQDFFREFILDTQLIAFAALPSSLFHR